MGIDKNRMKRLREHNGGFVYLEWLRFEKLRESNIRDSIIEYFERNNLSPGNLDFIIEKMTPARICNYLKRRTVNRTASKGTGFNMAGLYGYGKPAENGFRTGTDI